MRRPIRMSVMLALTGVLTSVLTLVPTGTASAAESIPTLKWPAVTIGQIDGSPVTSPNGDVTIPCSYSGAGSDLITYGAAGKVVRKISRTAVIDGVPNCITVPVADKNGVVYGRPYGKVGSSWKYGANLVAYSGNTLKWKYPLTCGTSDAPSYEVGANGNIYSTSRMSDGSVHLIGLTPEVAVGQTQPTKILDVKIQTDCTTVLRTYKDGIVMHAQTGGYARYYSYSGKFLGQATIGSLTSEKVNADGQLFVESVMMSGGAQGYGVSKYDPRTGDVRWTTPASTTGAKVSGIALSPLPGGAVAALITEQQMLSSGLPASPTVWGKTLAVINSSGAKVYSKQLDSTYAGGKYGNSYLTSENGGKVVVVRELTVNTGLSSPTTVPGVAIQVFDPASSTWTSRSIIGDLTKSGGPSGYRLESADLVASLPVNNALYVRVACTNNCDGSRKLFAVAVTGMGVEYPRGAVLNANTLVQPAPVSYVALGDSFSSGEGVSPFVDDTTCHRSALAYSRVNGLNPYSTLQLDKFIACSGAQTTNVLNAWTTDGHNEPSQVSVLSSGSPKVVTISIGGNDIFFTDFAKACVIDTCNFSTAAYSTSLNAMNNTLGASLTTTYKKLLEVTKTAGTKVYVLGYPQVIANKTANDPGDARCPYMYESVPVASGRYWEDARAARDIVTRLNAKIDDTVRAVRALSSDNQRLIFVTATGVNSPFTSHEVCGTGESYFNNVDQALSGLAYVFHPNAKGQAAYAQLVRQAIGE
jgi:lysophospholipase L1-like esterase